MDNTEPLATERDNSVFFPLPARIEYIVLCPFLYKYELNTFILWYAKGTNRAGQKFRRLNFKY